MAQLFDRAARVVLNSQLFEGLRMQFKVQKTDKKEPNQCELTIWNLSAASRALLRSKGTKVILEAGYTGSLAQIFSGDSTFIDHVHEGPDWQTKILCLDGERAYRFTTISDSFKAGTPVSAVFERVALSTGLDAQNAIQTVQANIKEQFTQGYVALGNSAVELDRLLRNRGLVWSVQDGRLQVLPTGKATNDQAVLLNASAGLIGTPEHGTAVAERKAQVMKVKSLLQGALKPGAPVQVESANLPGNSGLFRCLTVLHEGDTNGGDWYSSCEVVP